MCGILGTNFISDNFSRALSFMNNRGPDNSSVINHKNYQFGHTRLSIIDVDDEANQPMVFDDIVIVFNGEIYNFKELIISENLSCKTSSDTEVIIRLYQKFGIDFLNKLNGMFSFVIFDIKKEKYFCARDRYGKKPFFYYFKDNKFIFSSSIKSIIKILGTTPSFNKVALSQYLQYFVSLNDLTFYNDIMKLEASSYMTLSNNEIFIKKYYKVNTYKQISDEKIALNDIEELLYKSIDSRLVGDVEIGSLLSGGIDSSLISTLYTNMSGKKTHTFSVGYSDYKNYSELDYAKLVSNDINSIHHPLEITKRDFLDVFDDVIDALEEPHADSAAFPLFCLTKLINKNGIKVVLSGEGSDELFLGYDNYSKFLKYYEFKDSLSTSQNSFLKDIGSCLQNNTKESEYLRRVISDENIYNSFGEIYTTLQKKKLFKRLPNFKQEKPKKDPIDWMSYIDLKVWLGQSLLSKVDKISMANSIEVRTPFLDYRLVDYLFSIKTDLKVGDTNKYLLKKIAQKYIPQKIINRPKKGFNSPYNEWIFSTYDDDLLKLVLKVNSHTNLFNDDYVIMIYNLAKSNKFKQHFWALYIFSYWFNKNYLI
ncbi:asparagine synthase (glutamine-hydrolyzing) [uncultured Arcobacter sp.]|uniref:asparagine synthase (glutamine-hydrolyzing) n=1 Tax=uncultured Arcobacter sp. TaxID=165434 RepID=UPI00261DFDAC|nr:asparagine synthase (glutamine-hydrolyzing) [uncultured Arcobacter sp.]